ncbi:hypothetical protein BDL97_08G152300 [Sphagnum fallax]|nr:hypothetical protein BDL97_08G152300 [Sphagnum fallax]
MEPSSMTYDEAEMQRSHHFMQALKELRNLRPQLYSAAEYCESSYLYSDQKQVVLENLKDYSVKALVNAVDHLGTVAYKLNDLLNQQTAEISSVELRAASLAQRMRSCQEHSDREGLKQQSLAKTMHVNHKHYVLPDPYAAGEQSPAILRETFDTNQPRPLPPTRIQTEAHPLPSPKQLVVYQDPLPSADSAVGTNRSKTAEWHFASDAAPVASTHGSFTRLGQEPVPSATRASMLETSLSMRSFLTSFNQTGDQMPTTMDADLSTSNSQRLEKVGMMRSGSFAPTKSAPPVPAKSIAFTHSTTMLPIQTLPENGLTENSRAAPTRSKSLLRSLLQRRKSSSSSKTTNAS